LVSVLEDKAGQYLGCPGFLTLFKSRATFHSLQHPITLGWINSTIIDKLTLANKQVIAAGDGLFGLTPRVTKLSPAKFDRPVAQ